MNPESKKILLDTARISIEHGLEFGTTMIIHAKDYPQELQKKQGTFVTLKIHHELRGCMGVLSPLRPIIEDVALNAYAAAFRDMRFSKLTQKEFLELSISLSILNPAKPIKFSSEQDLINKIRPGVDGLILEEGSQHATYLPSVWEGVSGPKEFLESLKVKAGLTKEYWSDTIEIKRYTTENIK